MLEPAIKIRPVGNDIDLKSLIEAARKDNHLTISPSHIVVKGKHEEEIVGYLSLGCLPYVGYWMDSKKTNARDNFLVLQVMENLIACKGMTSYIMMCAKSSPFYQHLPRAGFEEIGSTTLHVKKV